MQKKFDVWSNQEVKDFPEIDEEKFKITDKKVIKELKNIMYKSEKPAPVFIQGSNQFSEKSQNIFGTLDTIKKEQPASVSNQWLYYNLEDVDIDDAKTRQSAYDFLDELKKRNEPIQNSNEMETEFKPTFSTRPDKMKIEKENKGKQSVERSRLSFGDEF